MTLVAVAEPSQEPSDSEIKQAIRQALARLGFDEYDDFFTFNVMTTFFIFDATGRRIVISVEETTHE